MFLCKFLRNLTNQRPSIIPKENIMSDLITMDLLENVLPNMKDKEQWLAIMSHTLPLYHVNTPLRVSAFISQCAHESSQFNVLSENLNYGANALLSVFGKYFNSHTAVIYNRDPENIANRVYANRMGNGNEESGDGWKFRGRGVIQLTGRNNYRQFGQSINIDLLKTPDLVSDDLEIALKSALWYWDQNSLNILADTMDFKQLTRRINGGYNGLDDRERYYRLLLSHFNI